MKAILGRRYGPPEVLQLEEVAMPTPGEGEVLVRVFAASLNAADWHGMRGGISRLFGGFWRPKDPRMGIDVAGRVEAVGPNVTRFKPGDDVFGGSTGSFAEFATARETRLARKPATVSFEEAAAAPVAGITALQGLRDKGRLRADAKVLVNGASGGVGTFAVQIAKVLGAEVTAVCSPRNLDQAHELGAEHVIDYTREDFAKNGQRYDLIFDIVYNHSITAYKRSLNPNGACVIAGIGFPSLSIARLLGLVLAGPVRSKLGDKTVGFMGMARLETEDLGYLGGLVEAGKLTPAIERRFPLDKTAAAMEYFGQGHARGKIVIDVDTQPPRLDASPPTRQP